MHREGTELRTKSGTKTCNENTLRLLRLLLKLKLHIYRENFSALHKLCMENQAMLKINSHCCETERIFKYVDRHQQNTQEFK
jgi:hypothetical protein